LQTAFESASGEKLGAFFAPWLDQQALPDVAITHAESSRSGKQYQLNITFGKQDANLPLRLPLEIRGAGKHETHWIDLAAARNTATLKLAFKPQTLRLDPEMRVWRRLAASQLPPILRQWMAASSPQLVNVARAAEANVAVNALAERIFEIKPKLLTPTNSPLHSTAKPPFCSPAPMPRLIRPWPAPACQPDRPPCRDKAAPRSGQCLAKPSSWPSSPARMRRRSTPCNAACPTTADKAG
jgi:hypothetical protein